MRKLGLQGAHCVKTVRTNVPDRSAPFPLDRVHRQSTADRPNQLSDFTYVSSWQGWLYVAFVLDTFARRIVGWRVSAINSPSLVVERTTSKARVERVPGRGGNLNQSPATAAATWGSNDNKEP